MATGPAISREQYAEALLNQLGAPVTASNLQFLVSWMSREGTAAAYNPLATTQRVDGSYALSGNSAGVQQYTSAETGIDATAQTLNNGAYGDILTALRSGDAMAQASSGALSKGLSAWSGGGYSRLGTSSSGGSQVPVSDQATTADTSYLNPTAAAAGNNQPPPPINANIDGFLKSQAPQLAKVLGSDPDVVKLLQQWGNNQISDDQFQQQLETTNWWKNTPATQRTQLVTEATDPASAQQNVDNLVTQINTTAAKMGVQLPPGQANLLALTTINNNWSTDHLNQHIASFAQYSGGNQQIKGQAGQVLQQLQNLYASYILPVSAQTLQTNMQQVLSGTQTVADFGQRLAQQAKSLYGNNPDLSDALDRGETTEQFMQPYADYAKSILGPSADNINWLDPKWNVALTGQTDPASGKTTPMGLAQWGQTLRSNPVFGYDTSPNAVQTASQFANQLTQALTGASI